MSAGLQHATAQADAITLDQRGGDVWARTRHVTGICPGCPPEAVIAFRVNEAVIPAKRQGDAFSATLMLAPGANEVMAVLERPNGSIERTVPVVYTVPLQPRPTARLSASVDGDHVVFDSTGSSPSEHDSTYLTTRMLALSDTYPRVGEISGESPGVWRWPIPAMDGEYEAVLTVTDELGRDDSAGVRLLVKDGFARIPDPVHEHANWIARAVVYGVTPRNFNPPTFAGVAARLDDLASLGVSALWLSPITRTNPGSYGYDVTDYFDLNPEYGTKEEFRALVAAAHERGMRVLMDFVPNHTSTDHPYFQDAQNHRQASSYWEYHDRDPGGNSTHYFNWDHLPNLNYDHPEVQRFMLEAFSFWMREVDIDGFRLDAIWGIRQRHPVWLGRFLEEMKRIKPDALLIAEASARDPFYAAAGFDAAYDWTDALGHWAWEGIFDGEAPIGQAITDALTNDGRGYHANTLVLRFLNNNDTGARFITRHGVGAYRVALAMLLTLPGLPCLFTGDEVGAEYEPYDAAGPIDWTDRHGLRPFTKRLIALRQGTPALHSGVWRPLAAEPAEPLFAFLREVSGERPVLVALNFSADDLQATLDLPDALTSNGQLTDLWSGETLAFPCTGKASFSVPGWGFKMLTDEG